MKLKNKLVMLLLIALPLVVSAVGQRAPVSVPVPGGIAVVDLGKVAQPQAFFGQRRVLVMPDQARWQAVVGIPLDTAPGRQTLRVKTADGEKLLGFNVVAKEYAEQHISISDKRKVNPLPQDLKRIQRESELIRAARANWSETQPGTLRLALPVAGRLSSPFGLKRFFNQQARRPHSGLDIAADTGTVIAAPKDGSVINTGEYFFNGKTVFLDHGQGFITLYCHLHEIRVRQGDRVKAGDIIGTVGKTGRATGPHLHWGVYLNNTAVDPAIFIEAVRDGE
ncbi:MAG: peptidoglycan DD-metalloendopeptidase family protein [Gammaproteobacteria bacterium]